MSTTMDVQSARKLEVLEKAVIRFCGDSGDGMQVTGNQFTNTVALYGNDLATFPDFPRRSAPPRVRCPASADSRSNFPLSTFTRRAMRWMRWSP